MWSIIYLVIKRSESICIYRVSQEECARLREGVPYVKVYRYNPKHLCPKLNGYGDNGQRKVWSSGRAIHCTCQLSLIVWSPVCYDWNSADASPTLHSAVRPMQGAGYKRSRLFGCVV